MKSNILQHSFLGIIACAAIVQTCASGVEPASVDTSPTIAPDWLHRDTLTGDWNGYRTTLQDHGILIKPRLTQFYQGLVAGDDTHDFEHGGKFDLLLNLNFEKLGLVEGLSFTVHAEQNFGQSVNGRGGILLPVNSAILLPGSSNSDASDLTSVFFTQKFSDAISLTLGKMNMIDVAAGKPFMGGAGIDAFQNMAFVAPPSGILPPYFLGSIFTVQTKPARFTFMIYDLDSAVNHSGLERPFDGGVTFRASIEIPVTLGGLRGHQNLAAAYSTQDGTDLSSLGDIILPATDDKSVGIKDHRYQFAYSFDQYLYKPNENSGEGFGLFGQVSISDGNPNPLDWSIIAGVGGTGLIPGRAQDKWGLGFYHYSVSNDLKRSLASSISIDDEQGVELFYNAAITPWFDLGVDVQIIDPALSGNETQVITSLRSVIRF